MNQKSQPELFNDAFLVQRLSALGLRGVRRVESHQNHAVMVSVTCRGVLRIHQGYAYAPDSVLAAIVTFVKPGTRLQRRRAAQDVILAFPVDQFVPPQRVRRRRLIRFAIPAAAAAVLALLVTRDPVPSMPLGNPPAQLAGSAPEQPTVRLAPNTNALVLETNNPKITVVWFY